MLVTVRNNKTNEVLLSNERIPNTRNIYTYGKHIANVIKPYMNDRINALISVSEDDGTIIHSLQIIPKGGSVMVTENGVDTFTCRKFFPENNGQEEKYLVCVNPEHNNNKFYRLIDIGNGQCGALYGRCGNENGGSWKTGHEHNPHPYPAYMFWIKYYEKICKGYKDVTELHNTDSSTEISAQKKYEPISDKAVNQLIQKLMAFAKKTIDENYTIKASDVTPEMVEAAEKVMTKLRTFGERKRVTKKCIDEFNKTLTELFTVLPRKIDGQGSMGVASQMATCKEHFGDIIQRESDLIDVMKTQVKINITDTKHLDDVDHDKKLTLLDALGIECYVATTEQRNKVISKLSDTLKPKVKNVYRVINKNTQKRFDEYLNTHKVNGRKPQVKELWHGSRNENWISIMQNGLLLNPNAVITGKMFGNGIYFAPSSMKSWGYTSASGSYWARGNSDCAFMAVYATAYGTPYVVNSHSGNWYDYNYDRLQKEHPGCYCVHADSSAGMLRNDEIIFYKEEQMTINYIVEFNA